MRAIVEIREEERSDRRRLSRGYLERRGRVCGGRLGLWSLCFCIYVGTISVHTGIC